MKKIGDFKKKNFYRLIERRTVDIAHHSIVEFLFFALYITRYFFEKTFFVFFNIYNIILQLKKYPKFFPDCPIYWHETLGAGKMRAHHKRRLHAICCSFEI